MSQPTRAPWLDRGRLLAAALFIAPVAACISSPSPAGSGATLMTEWIEQDGSEQSTAALVAPPEQQQQQQQHLEVAASGTPEHETYCSEQGICSTILCRVGLHLAEEETSRSAVSSLCPDGARWTSAGLLASDRIASMSADRDELVLHPRRFDGERRAELALLAHTDAGEPAVILVDVHITDTTEETPLVEVERVEVDGFQYRVYHAPGPDGVVNQRYPVLVSIPDSDGPMPVEVFLHGFFGEPRLSAEADHITIMPADPDNTYWWGENVGGRPQPVTQWRVVDAVAQLVDEIPSADASRVVIAGASMGGAGAAAIGFTYPELFAGVVATDGQAVPRNHRQRRISQLSGPWGPPGELDAANVAEAWDTTDLTWLLEQNPRARQLPVFSRFGRDDGIIHFGALVHRSPLTGESWMESLNRHDVALVLGWDEGGHVAVAEWLADHWWTAGWNPLTDPITYVSRDTVVLGSRHSDWDGDPGDGQGNGRRERHPDSAFAGNPGVRDDDGWSGEPQGVIGGWVAWMNEGISESPDRTIVPVRLAASAPEDSGRVDILIRQLRTFPRLATDSLRWSMDGQDGGDVERLESGALLARGVWVTAEWQELELVATRREP